MTLAIQMFDTHRCGRTRTSVGLRHWDSAGERGVDVVSSGKS